jgi:beta-galactosidase
MNQFQRTAVMARHSVILLFAIILLPTGVVAAASVQESAPFTASETRKVYDLGGQWQRIEDGVAVSSATVPGDLAGDESVKLRRVLRIDSTTLERNSWHLQFFGMADAVELVVNGRFIMRYPGGMIPFSIRVRDGILRPGSNTIELNILPAGQLARSVLRNGRAAAKQYLGILRELFLVGTPHVWTESARIRTSIQGGTGQLNVSARIMSGMIEKLRVVQSQSDVLSSSNLSFGVEARVVDRRSGTVISTTGLQSSQIGRAREVAQVMNLNVPGARLWSPGSPNLYDLEVRLSVDGMLVDVFRQPFGFRKITVGMVDGSRRLLVNDTAIRLYAIDYFEDAPGRGPALSVGQMQYDVSLMKTLGVNAVRVVHGSPHPVFLSLCDTYGIMVLADIPCSDVPADVLGEAELATRHRNSAERTLSYLDPHPSVLGVGLSDGLDEQSPEVARYHEEMARYTRRMSSKLVFKTVSSRQLGLISEGGFDFVIVDFPALSDSSAILQLRRRDQPMFASAAVIARFGGRVSPSNTSGFSDPLSNEAQALLISKYFAWATSAQLAGMLVWSFNDYRLERATMLVDHYDPFLCTSGLVDTYRQRRVSFEMYKALINDEKLPLLQARDGGFSTPIVFIVGGILLAIMLALIANRSRRFREYFIRALIRPYNFYADIRDQRILSTAQTGMLASVISGGVGLVVASFLYFVRVNPNIESILHVLVPNDGIYSALRYVAWHPELSTLAWSIGVLLWLGLLSVLLRAGAFFVRSRISIRDTFTIVTWSGLPYIIMLPIGIALYQALSDNELSLMVPLTVFLVSVWVMFRMLRATSVVFDARPSVVYLIGLGLILLVAISAVFSLDFTNHGFSFLTHFVNVG